MIGCSYAMTIPIPSSRLFGTGVDDPFETSFTVTLLAVTFAPATSPAISSPATINTCVDANISFSVSTELGPTV